MPCTRAAVLIMLSFKLIYADKYYLPIGEHVFPAQKYRLIAQELIVNRVATNEDFLTPEPARDADILLVHTPEWVCKLTTGTLSPREELLMEIPYSRDLVQAFWLAAGGSILAARCALRDRVGISIGGGFHHAFPDHGEGFCMIHDVAVAVRWIRDLNAAGLDDKQVELGIPSAEYRLPVLEGAPGSEGAQRLQLPRVQMRESDRISGCDRGVHVITAHT